MLNARTGSLWFAVTLCTANLSACNTVKGFGTDMQNLGQKIARKIDQKDSSHATNREVRLEVQREARTEPTEGQKATLTAPAAHQPVEREDQEREDANPDNEADNTQNELDRIYEEQMQRRAQ